MKKLRVVLIKPSKYLPNGYVQRFESGFMPNATLPHIASLTPDQINEHLIEIIYVDEYVRTDLDYLDLLRPSDDSKILVAIVGVQSHQFHRAIDIAAFALNRGVKNIVIGGPHPMTCDTSILHGRGVSFSLSEAEVVWRTILEHSIEGELLPIYGSNQRWAKQIEDVPFKPLPLSEIKRSWAPMIGYYPVRGCPFTCNFCSVIKIAGRQVRNPSIDAIVSALKTIKKAGIDLVMFTSDNFNKFPGATSLLNAIIDEKIGIRFFFQADTQIAKQPDLVELIARAGGLEMFLGVESFDSQILKDVHKHHNKPRMYGEIIRLCREYGIRAHFSNIIGFPSQTEQDIDLHIDTLIDLNPEFASFYILTPIPGTEQYKEYRKADLVFEKNLDRFDSYTLTFDHQYISSMRMSELLFNAYMQFYKHSMNANRNRIDRETRNYMVFCRWSAANKMHPMSSGGGQVFLDNSVDYETSRSAIFRVGKLLPLPDNLELSKVDQEINRQADWRTSH